MPVNPLLAILQEKAIKWQNNREINPIHAIIDIQSAWKSDSEPLPHVTFDVRMRYSTLIRILLCPLYVIAAIVSPDFFDYLEDISYFKCVTRRSINKRYAELSRIHNRVADLIDEEVQRFDALSE